MTQTPRRMTAAEHPLLAHLWHQGWHEAHAAHVPNTLVALRLLSDFDTRLTTMQEQTRCIGPIGDPVGFCSIKGDEIEQLFVSVRARGTGAAQQLLQDGEDRLRANGVHTAHLLCIPENAQAIAFYQKHGWRNRGPVLSQLHSSEGSFPLETLVLEKQL